MIELHVPFMVRARQGELNDPFEEIDQAVSEWHDSTTQMSLSEWLGMTMEEYKIWVETPLRLEEIINR